MIEYIRAKLHKKLSLRDLGPNPLLRKFNILRVLDGFVQREITTDEGVKHQFVLAIAQAPTVMDALYNDMGNPGKGGIISLMKDMWYWPGIYSNVETLIDHLSRVCEMQQGETWYMYTGDNVRPNFSFFGF